MIKFNIECAFTREPRLENSSLTDCETRNEIESNKISDDFKELKKVQKEASDNILKLQEEFNLKLTENSNELSQVLVNTNSCLKIIEQIAFDNAKIKECLESFKSKHKFFSGISVLKNCGHSSGMNFKHEENQVNVDIKRLCGSEMELQNKLGNCDKGTQSDIKLSCPNQSDGIRENKNEIKVSEAGEARNNVTVKCCYCKESHLNNGYEKQKIGETETKLNKENKENRNINFPSSGEVSTSNTWPLNRKSSNVLENSIKDPVKTDILKSKSLPEKNVTPLCSTSEECTSGVKPLSDTYSEQTQLKSTTEMKNAVQNFSKSENQSCSNTDSKVVVDKSVCTVCKTSSCNLKRPLCGKYSSQFYNSGNSRKFGSSGKVGINQNYFNSSSKSTCSNLISRTKTTKSSALNVASDLYKRHFKNCTVHGCVPQEKIKENLFQRGHCDDEAVSQLVRSDCTKVEVSTIQNCMKEYSCHNLDSEIQTAVEDLSIKKFEDNNFETKSVCKGFNAESNYSEEKSIHPDSRPTRDCKQKESAADSIQIKEDKNNIPNNIFSTSKRNVLALALEAKRNKEYKFMWFRGGKVFMKKEENSPVMTINNPSDINNL